VIRIETRFGRRARNDPRDRRGLRRLYLISRTAEAEVELEVESRVCLTLKYVDRRFRYVFFRALSVLEDNAKERAGEQERLGEGEMAHPLQAVPQ